jgi:hypothetical protein
MTSRVLTAAKFSSTPSAIQGVSATTCGVLDLRFYSSPVRAALQDETAVITGDPDFAQRIVKRTRTNGAHVSLDEVLAQLDGE